MDKILISEDRYGPKRIHYEDDDLVDRLNSRYTILALIMCILIITGKIHVGDPINCWTPAQFTGPHNSYTNSICWLKGSYYLPTEEINIPDRSKPRLHHVSYYQWTPFILLGMAMFFLLPRLLWQAFARQAGVNTERLVKTIKDKPDDDASIELGYNTLKNHLDRQGGQESMLCCGFACRRFYSIYAAVYIIIKIFYIINTICQFFLLNSFLSFHFTSYGPEALSKLFSGEDWFESPRFPRVTMCDFMIRHLGSNQHWYAIQCNLPINIYNEKIFLGIWIWLIILTILNILSLIYLMISLTSKYRSATVKRYLKLGKPKLKINQDDESPENEKITSYLLSDEYGTKDIHEFMDYLQVDGFLIFHLIARNTDDIVAGKIINLLFSSCPKPSKIRTSSV